MRGFLGGVAIGALVSGLGAALVSLAVPFPQSVEVTSADPQAARAPGAVPSVPQDNVVPDADLVEAAPVAPNDPNDGDKLSVLGDDIAVPATKPTVGSVNETLELTDVARDFADVSEPSVLDAPALAEGIAAPDAPSPETVPVVETTSAPLPEDEPEAIVISEETQPAPVVIPEAAPAIASVAEPDVDSAVAGGVEESTLPDTAPSAQVPAEGESSTRAQASVEEDVEDTRPEAATPQVPSTEAPQIALNVPQIGAPDLGSNLPGVTLPQVSAPPASQSAPGEAVVDPAETDVPETPNARRPFGTPGVQLQTQGSRDAASDEPSDTDLPAFVRNAEEFILIDDRPLMSIVLIDEIGSVGADALVDFPYPLSFAVHADDPRSAAKAQAHRAAGFEVLMLVDLPREAGPKEAEAAMALWMPKLPQAVAVLEGVDTGFQGNRPLADQMAALVAGEGYGLVTQAKGLNTVQKLAQRDGVPSAVVFRDFDGAGQDPRAMRRFLDQAAFRAGQEGAVIMLGRLQPDTISALLLWGLQDRASRVQLAPVSASLATGQAPQ